MAHPRALLPRRCGGCSGKGLRGGPGAPLKNLELEIIHKVLRQTGGNMQETAKILGISRTTLWRKLRSQTKV
ncbi:MAG TPA: hypothetical protein GX499_05100 [Clostridiales bacterium]|nr:hypothetical protein [Clostridiales bacterium]